jgi:hypothetical protein
MNPPIMGHGSRTSDKGRETPCPEAIAHGFCALSADTESGIQ